MGIDCCIWSALQQFQQNEFLSVMPGLLFFLLCGYWLLLSGHDSTFFLLHGLASALVTLFLCVRLRIGHNGYFRPRLFMKAFRYLVFLEKEIVLSSVDVIRCIKKGPAAISPAFATISMHYHTDIARMLYANSITLTPGTLSADVTEQHITVHALHKDGIVSLENSTMHDAVLALEKEIL